MADLPNVGGEEGSPGKAPWPPVFKPVSNAMWKTGDRARFVHRANAIARGCVLFFALPFLCTVRADGLAPELAADAGYATAEAAFNAVFIVSGLGLRAYRENRE